MKFITSQISKINRIAIVALLLIHFVFKESTFLFSVLYYTFPLPVIIVAVLMFSFFLRKKARTFNFILAGILIVIWFGRSFKINSAKEIKGSDIELVFWNASHKREFKDVFEKNETLPDVVVLDEYHADLLAETKIKYPDYFYYWNALGEIGIFSKKTINIEEVIFSDDNTVIVSFKTYGLQFYALDVAASINIPREREFDFVDKAIKIKEQAIVLGDFNTPYESRFFNTIKTHFKHAFTEKGNGFRETWFWNLPLLSLDHIWVSKDLTIIKSEKLNTFKSDHNMVKVIVRK